MNLNFLRFPGEKMKNQHDLGRKEGDFILLKPTEVENELPFQLTGVGCDFYQYGIERPFGFASFQWIQTRSGGGMLELEGRSYPVGTGQGILLYPGVSHKYYPAQEPWFVNWITLTGKLVPDMLKYVRMPGSGVYTLSHPQAVENRIHKAYRLLTSQSYLKGIQASAMAYELLLDFLQYLEKEGEVSHSSNVDRLQPVFDMIEENIHHPLSLEDMAEAIGVTPQYFCDLFKAVTNQRPVEYINQRRIDRAKELLIRAPQLKIHEIALDVGFESDSYFGTVFRKQEGVSPRQFRASNGSPL